jgi:hypothetical protein
MRAPQGAADAQEQQQKKMAGYLDPLGASCGT